MSDRIAELPTASAVRYKNVRCKPMKRFPFLITFTIDDTAHSVNILRVFNTYQEPFALIGQSSTEAIFALPQDTHESS